MAEKRLQEAREDLQVERERLAQDDKDQRKATKARAQEAQELKDEIVRLKRENTRLEADTKDLKAKNAKIREGIVKTALEYRDLLESLGMLGPAVSADNPLDISLFSLTASHDSKMAAPAVVATVPEVITVDTAAQEDAPLTVEEVANISASNISLAGSFPDWFESVKHDASSSVQVPASGTSVAGGTGVVVQGSRSAKSLTSVAAPAVESGATVAGRSAMSVQGSHSGKKFPSTGAQPTGSGTYVITGAPSVHSTHSGMSGGAPSVRSTHSGVPGAPSVHSTHSGVQGAPSVRDTHFGVAGAPSVHSTHSGTYVVSDVFPPHIAQSAKTATPQMAGAGSNITGETQKLPRESPSAKSVTSAGLPTARRIASTRSVMSAKSVTFLDDTVTAGDRNNASMN